MECTIRPAHYSLSVRTVLEQFSQRMLRGSASIKASPPLRLWAGVHTRLGFHSASAGFCLQKLRWLWTLYNDSALHVPTRSASRGGDVAVYVFDINQPSLPTPFHSFPVSIFVSMALSTIFHSINCPDNPPISHSILPVLFLPYWSFQLYISLSKSPSALI